MKELSNMLLTFAEDGDVDIMLRFVPKFVELQKYLTDNHDALVNDEEYNKTNSQLATLITYVAERIEKHAEKTYPKDSAEYKQNMLLAYETAIKADLRYLDKQDAYYRQYFMDRIKCKAFDLYEKELKLEVNAPTTIVKGEHFEVTYSYNQEGKNFKMEDNPNVHKSSGPIADQKYVPIFKTTIKFTFVCHKEGIFEIPRASVQIDGETLQFPARHITVNSKVVSSPTTNTTIPQFNPITSAGKPSSIFDSFFTQPERNSKPITKKPTVSETPTNKQEEDSVSEVQFQAVKHKISLYAKYLRLPKWVKALIKLPILLLTIILGAVFCIMEDGSIYYIIYVLWMVAILCAGLAIFTDWEQWKEYFGMAIIPALVAILISIIFYPKCRIIKDKSTYSKRMYMTTELVYNGQKYYLNANQRYILNATGRPLYISQAKYGRHSSFDSYDNTNNVRTINPGIMIKDPGVDGFFVNPPSYIQVKRGTGTVTRLYLDFEPH